MWSGILCYCSSLDTFSALSITLTHIGTNFFPIWVNEYACFHISNKKHNENRVVIKHRDVECAKAKKKSYLKPVNKVYFLRYAIYYPWYKMHPMLLHLINFKCFNSLKPFIFNMVNILTSPWNSKPNFTHSIHFPQLNDKVVVSPPMKQVFPKQICGQLSHPTVDSVS